MENSIKIISKSEYLKNHKKPVQEDVWDEIADLWVECRQGKIPIVAEFLKGKKGRIVDLGCGSGRNMINPKLEYYEVDFSEEQLKSAEKISEERKINAKFFKSKIDKLDLNIFKNNIFDYGLFIATLHCLESGDERENALKEFYRVLKNGAEALTTVWNSEDKRFDNVKNHGDIYMSWRKDGKEYMRNYYLYSKDELLDLLKKTGFEILEIYPAGKDRFSKKNWIVRVRK